MKKTLTVFIGLMLIVAGVAGQDSQSQRTLRDRILGGQPAGAKFSDAQVVLGSDGLLQILAVGHEGLRQGGLRGPAQAGGALGLWHAYQAADGSWNSSGMVYDLSAFAQEGVRSGTGLTAAAVAGDLQIVAAVDPGGRLQVVIINPDSGGRFAYLVRNSGSQWRVVASDAVQDELAEMSLLTRTSGGGVSLLGLTQGGGGGARIAEYALSAAGGERRLFPENIRPSAFAVSSSGRTNYFLLQFPDGELQAIERDVATGKWNLDAQKFMRGFRDPIGGAQLRSMCGFLDANGLPQVVGLAGGGGVVHIYRDEIGTWYNNGVALQAGGLRRVSGCLDGRGLINVLGVTNDGRLWHGYRAENQQWRDNGVIF